MDITSYKKYLDILHEHALVEDDLREIAGLAGFDIAGVAVAERILFERFGVGGGL